MFTKLSEQKFFLSSIDKTKKVLEYGSGHSTIEIAQLAKEIVSVEHQKNWYEKNLNSIPQNCTLLFEPPQHSSYREGIDDGTYIQFKNYVEAPLKYAPFDIIYIDGRARVACASFCKNLGHKETLVFIHDFNRSEYKAALEYLNAVDSCETMAKFTIKYD